MNTSQTLRRRTPDEIVELAERFRRERKTQKEFAKAEGICVATLQRYLRAHSSGGSRFVEVDRSELRLPGAGGPASEPYRVVFERGVSLEVPRGFSGRELEQILGLLVSAR